MSEYFIGSLPDEVRNALQLRFGNVLRRHGVSELQLPAIVSDLTDKVGFAVAGLPRKAAGRGKPPDIAADLLAENVLHVLKEHGLSDAIWRESNDDEGFGGRLSLATELESIAHVALGHATGKARGSEGRPARISKARKLLDVKRPRVRKKE